MKSLDGKKLKSPALADLKKAKGAKVFHCESDEEALAEAHALKAAIDAVHRIDEKTGKFYGDPAEGFARHGSTVVYGKEGADGQFVELSRFEFRVPREKSRRAVPTGILDMDGREVVNIEIEVE